MGSHAINTTKNLHFTIHLVITYIFVVVFFCSRRRAQSLQPTNKPFAFKVNDEQPKSGAVARLRLRLMRFLIHPGANYSFSRLLAKCPYDAFFEERAFLLAKLNKHEQVCYVDYPVLINFLFISKKD